MKYSQLFLLSLLCCTCFYLLSCDEKTPNNKQTTRKSTKVNPQVQDGHDYEADLFKYIKELHHKSLASTSHMSAEEIIADYTKQHGDIFSFGIEKNQKITLVYFKEKNNASITSIEIPYFVNNISNSAFYHAKYIENVSIPDSVESIGVNAFRVCKSLKNINIPLSVTEISAGAFCNCSSLVGITLHHSLTSIGEHAFGGCNQLKNITIPASVTFIGALAYGSSRSINNKNFTLQGKQYKISKGLFIDKKNGILLGAIANRIKPNMILPKSITRIAASSFYQCNTLESIIIPDSVTSIEKYAFSDCTSLKSIIIPQSVTSIGICAFSGCSALENITIQGNRFQVTKGLIIDNKTHTLITAINSLIDSHIILPKTVTSIGDNAFTSCSKMKAITLHQSVTSIGAWAFSSCPELKNITIPDSISLISSKAFFLCSSLESITIPSSVTVIGDNAFGNCKSLQNITIPDSVKKIHGGAFSNCPSIKSIFVGQNSPVKESLIKDYGDKVNVK